MLLKNIRINYFKGGHESNEMVSRKMGEIIKLLKINLTNIHRESSAIENEGYIKFLR